METQNQILFFFAFLGAFNALFLSIYFAFFVKHRFNANYFLSALLLAIGIKIIPSVFRYFNRTLDETVVELGLSAHALIGPLFYLYVKQSLQKESLGKYWWLHVIPAAMVFPLIGYIYPSTFDYTQGATTLSRYVVGLSMLLWFIYLAITAILLQNSFKKLFSSKRFALDDEKIWLTSLWIAIFIFWFGPIVTMRTTYMVGALSFSLIFYGLLFFWIFKFRRTSGFFEPKVKYATKKIDTPEADMLSRKLNQLFEEKELFRNSNLKIADVANELQISSQRLSQFLNDNLGKSFSSFTNEHRINAAKKMLLQNDLYTAEAIGYECGFNSKSTFFTTFKKLTGHTPLSFKERSK